MEVNGTYACRRAPIIKKMPTSAVALLTATGVLDTAIPVRALDFVTSKRVAVRTLLRTSININIVIACTVMADVL